MEDPFTTAVKQAIQDRYKQKYGRVTLNLDEVVTLHYEGPMLCPCSVDVRSKKYPRIGKR